MMSVAIVALILCGSALATPPRCTFDELREYPNKLGLAHIVSANRLARCAEVGVQEGVFSEQMLSRAPEIAEYHLVDVWRQQENYKDFANVDDGRQMGKLAHTVQRLRPYAAKTVYHIAYSAEAVRTVGELDFVYIDARHDYCGVSEDLRLYFDAMARCAVMSGDDFLTAGQVADLSGQDFGLCANGTRHGGAVKQAVLDFHDELSARSDVVVSELFVATDEGWPTWYFALEKLEHSLSQRPSDTATFCKKWSRYCAQN
jgi:predicted O-methyltransferase YrrM